MSKLNSAGKLIPTEDDLVKTEDQSGDYSGGSSKVGELLNTTHPSYIKWEDALGPASSGKAGGMDVDTNGDFLAAATGTENAYFKYQLPHKRKLASFGYPHVHWRKTTDAAGGVVWQMKWRLVSTGSVPTAWSAWIDTYRDSHAMDDTQKMIISDWPAIDISGAGMSDIIELEVQRVHDAAGDTYDADARLTDLDIHIHIDSHGSTGEYVK